MLHQNKDGSDFICEPAREDETVNDSLVKSFPTVVRIQAKMSQERESERMENRREMACSLTY